MSISGFCCGEQKHGFNQKFLKKRPLKAYSISSKSSILVWFKQKNKQKKEWDQCVIDTCRRIRRGFLSAVWALRGAGCPERHWQTQAKAWGYLAGGPWLCRRRQPPGLSLNQSSLQFAWPSWTYGQPHHLRCCCFPCCSQDPLPQILLLSCTSFPVPSFSSSFPSA